MRILVVCQHYWPEPYRLPDICEELVKRGHTVKVITDVPNYPMGVTYEGYEKGKQRNQEHNGVSIHRCYTIPRKTGAFFRFLNYYSYAISASLWAKQTKEEFDVVFVNQTSPVMMAYPALMYAKKHSKKVVLYCQDLWPACLQAGGIRKGSLIDKLFHWVSGRIYRAADHILISSKGFREYLITEHHVPNERIEYLPQHAEDLFQQEAVNKAVEKETIDFVFAGNVGAAQSIDTILLAADVLGDDKRLRWHIVGDGSELERCKKIAAEKHLDSIVFHGRKPLEEMPQYYRMADAMILTLTDDSDISRTLPGKIQTYLAAGKPVLCAANGEVQDVVREANCGYTVGACDWQGLAECVRKFLENREIVPFGENARKYFSEHFSKEKVIGKLETELMKFQEEEKMSQDIKVLLVSPLPPPDGGMATWTKKFMEACPDAGIQAHIVNTAITGDRSENFAAVKVNSSELDRTFRIVKNFYKQSHTEQADVIHINTSCARLGIIRDWVCMMLAPKKSKIVMHCHCNIADQLGNSKIGQRFFKMAANKADCILTLNEYSQSFAQSIGKPECKMVPNFIDAGFLKKEPKIIRENVEQVLFTGHVMESKGFNELLETAKQFPEISFVLAGQIPDETVIENIPENVQMLGSVSHDRVLELLDESDVFLFPSYTEGFSNSLVEAMARGVPAIATDVGANRDMLEDKGGIVIPAKNAEAVVSALREIKNQDVRAAMSEWSINKVKNSYLINPVIEKLKNIYLSLLEKKENEPV